MLKIQILTYLKRIFLLLVVKVNLAITNVMSAIENGVFTHTTKNRLEEL